MSNAFFKVPTPINEPVLSYVKGSKERQNLDKAIIELKSKPLDIPMIIGGKKIFTDKKLSMHPPHDLSFNLGTYNRGDASHVEQAIEASLNARENRLLLDQIRLFF